MLICLRVRAGSVLVCVKAKRRGVYFCEKRHFLLYNNENLAFPKMDILSFADFVVGTCPYMNPN